MTLEEFTLKNNDTLYNRYRILDKKKINRGNYFSTILTEEMKNVLKYKDEENKKLAVKFGNSILYNNIRVITDNLRQIQSHERNFIEESVDNG